MSLLSACAHLILTATGTPGPKPNARAVPEDATPPRLRLEHAPVLTSARLDAPLWDPRATPTGGVTVRVILR